MKRIIVAATFCLMMLSGSTQDPTSNTYGKGLKIQAKDSSFSMKIGMRFQTLYEGTLNLETDEWSDKVLIRRSRLKFGGYAYSPRLVYKVELAVSNRDNGKNASETNNAANIVLDAVLKYGFAENWQVWFGQTKLPGNRERVISSQQLQFVDRSQLNSKYTVDRGTGIQLRHKRNFGSGVLKEQGAITMGEGRNVTASNVGGYELTGRIEYLPMGEFTGKGDYFGSDLKREKTPKLAIGVTYDQNYKATRVKGFSGSFLSEPRDLQTVFIDAMFKYAGFSYMGEYASKQSVGNPLVADGAGNPTPFQTGTGINQQVGYLFQNNFEISGRYTAISPEDNLWSDDYSELTLGFSRYIVGHNLKVQSDATYVNHEIDDDDFRFRFQVEMAF